MSMEENRSRKVVIISLAGLLIGSLLFIFGVSIKDSLLPLIVNYLFALLLYISAFLAVFNNNKKDSQAIYKYIMILSIVLIVSITVVIISNIM